MDNVIDCLKERGLIDAVTSQELRVHVQHPIKLYVGFDPTADSFHLGNLVGIVMLGWFQRFGHTPFVILGGATGRIGDPSGKSTERPLLDVQTIMMNVRRIRAHFELVLDFFHPTARPIVLNNDDWFGKISFVDFLRDIGKYFRVNVMLTKESVKARLESEEGISFTEFCYMLMQAYDFYHLNETHGVVLQMGGSDQWGNITAGVELIRKLSGKSAYGLTFPLLTRSDGKKFGKTEGGAVWLAGDRFSPYDFYQYLYRVPDADVIRLMRMLTFMDLREIRAIENDMKQPSYEPNTAQKRLAEELTQMIHGEKGLKTALRVTQAASPGQKGALDASSFQQIIQDMPHVALTLSEVIGERFVDVAAKIGLFPSKSEAIRLINQGGAYLNNEKIEDPQFRFAQENLVGGKFILLAAGKKKKMLIKISR